MRLWRLFPLRQVEARQLVGVGREIELLGVAVCRHISVQRFPIGLLGGALDRGRIGLFARLGVVRRPALGQPLGHVRIARIVVGAAIEKVGEDGRHVVNRITAPASQIQAQLAGFRALDQRAKAGELRLYLGSWGSYSINDVSAILPNFLDGGADDYARDPVVTKWLVEGGSSNDPEARRKAYSAAIQRITERAYWAPLHTYVTIYG